MTLPIVVVYNFHKSPVRWDDVDQCDDIDILREWASYCPMSVDYFDEDNCPACYASSRAEGLTRLRDLMNRPRRVLPVLGVCDVDGCTQPGVYEWKGVVHTLYSPILGTTCKWLYCDEHDEWVRGEKGFHGKPLTPRIAQEPGDSA